MNQDEIKPCIIQDSVSVLEDCIPDCTRFTGVNDGQPIRFYHDLDNWNPNFYTRIDDASPLQYLLDAMALWQEHAPCVQLFELVDDISEADVRIIYRDEDPETPCTTLASATCVCDEQDDVCVRQFDHSAVFGPTSTLGTLTMYYVECLQAGMNSNRWVNLYLHELGHILGMGHVHGVPGVESIMGSSNRFGVPEVFAFDIEQLQLRHPCGCNVLQPLTEFTETIPATLNQTGEFCPGCQLQ